MPLDQWFSKWDPWASSVNFNMTQELVRKANSQVASHIYWITSPPGNSGAISSLRATGLDPELLEDRNPTSLSPST